MERNETKWGGLATQGYAKARKTRLACALGFDRAVPSGRTTEFDVIGMPEMDRLIGRIDHWQEDGDDPQYCTGIPHLTCSNCSADML